MVREQKGQGAKVPGSNLARQRISQGPIGRFAPGSEHLGPGAKRLGTTVIVLLVQK